MFGFTEFPLVIFTVLAQTAVGAYCLLCCPLMRSSSSKELAGRLWWLVAFLATGFAASIFHLGEPMRAFYVFTRVGESWLSTEIASGSAFLGLLTVYCLAAQKFALWFKRLYLLLLLLVGGVFILAMISLYQIPSVPTWNTHFTALHFVLTAILAGTVLAAMVLAGPHAYSRLFWGYCSALVITAIVSFYQIFELAPLRNGVSSIAALLPDYPLAISLRFGLLLLGAWAFWARKGILALFLVIAAELLGRSLFYGIFLSSGTTLN